MKFAVKLPVAAVALGLVLSGCGSKKEPAFETEVTVGSTPAVTIEKNGAAAPASAQTVAVPDSAAQTVAVPDTAAITVADASSGDECPAADGSAARRQQLGTYPPMCIDVAKKYAVTMETTKGTMTFELDPARAPKTVNSFVVLARYHYFDGITFHRVVRDFVIQGGDPTGTGTGNPGYAFEDELPKQGEYKIGDLAMANSGPNTNGSQFFIITGANGAGLPPLYSLFGRLTSGEDVMKTINALGPDGQDGPPSEAVSMTKVTVAEV